MVDVGAAVRGAVGACFLAAVEVPEAPFVTGMF